MFFSKDKIQKLVEEGEIEIVPFNPKNLKGASYTFTLSSKVKVLKKKEFLDSRIDPEFDELEISENGYELKPNEFAIFYTNEKVNLKGKYVCLLSTRSTIAQMGLEIMKCSFFAEPDTNNQFALEITNLGALPVRLYAGIKIVKGVFSGVI